MNLQNLADLAQSSLDIPLWAGMGFLGVIYLMFRHQLQRNYEIHAALVTISNQLAELRKPLKEPVGLRVWPCGETGCRCDLICPAKARHETCSQSCERRERSNLQTSFSYIREDQERIG